MVDNMFNNSCLIPRRGWGCSDRRAARNAHRVTSRDSRRLLCLLGYGNYSPPCYLAAGLRPLAC